MSRGVKFLLKWLLVPSALAVVGYAYVGPRLGGELAEKAARRLQKSGLAEKIPGALKPGTTATPESTNEPQPDTSREPAPDPDSDRSTKPAATTSNSSSGPAIKVDVAPAEGRQRSESSRRRSGRSESTSTRSKPNSESSTRTRAEGKPATPPAEPMSDPAGIGTGAAPGGTEDPEPGRPTSGGGVPL